MKQKKQKGREKMNTKNNNKTTEKEKKQITIFGIPVTKILSRLFLRFFTKQDNSDGK